MKAVHQRISGGKEFLSGEAFDDLLKTGQDIGLEGPALDIAVSQFGQSYNFDTADGYFTSLIKPNLRLFSKKQLENLIKEIEGNGQICGRGRAATHHRQITQVVDAMFSGKFDYSAYPRFADSVGIDLKRISRRE